MPGQSIPEGGAGELAATIAVEDHTACVARSAGAFKRADAKLFFHVVIHSEAYDLAVITIQNRSDIQLSVRARNLRNVGQPFLIWEQPR
ncbi:hypothetical protein SDC9_124727 [bioreactor metagenome]|uniref:Uncharacterized protein n=1 Tax=bioreactor metagenome TaxID=1076179 RepID=A0A645CLC6_9ZZZZ